MTTQHHRIVIVGSGFAGIGMAIRLRQDGERDFVVLERATTSAAPGATTPIPAARCDVPSHLYSFSFAPNPDWTRTFSPQPEIRAYLRDVRASASASARTSASATSSRGATWDEDASRWRARRPRRASSPRDVLVARRRARCSEPVDARPPRASTRFEGTVFHSARWDHDHDLDRRAGRGDRHRRLGDPVRARDPARGRAAARSSSAPRRGSCRAPTGPITRGGARGSTAAFPRAQRVDARRASTGRASAFVLGFAQPAAHGAGRQGSPSAHLRRQVPDPALRAQAHARLRDGLQAHPALRRLPARARPQPNVEVSPTAIAEVRAARRSSPPTAPSARSTRSSSAPASTSPTCRSADRVRGRDGRTPAPRPGTARRSAYLGTTVAGFPNLFLLSARTPGSATTRSCS